MRSGGQGAGRMSEDLESIAATLVADGKGILAAVPIPLGAALCLFWREDLPRHLRSTWGRRCHG